MKRKLGKSGIEVSAIGLGCWAVGGPWTWINVDEPFAAGWGDVVDPKQPRPAGAAYDQPLA